MDLFELGSGSQVHDVNGGILPNGLFWTVALPQHTFRVIQGGQRASLHARAVPQIDSFQFGGINTTPASLDIRVDWRVTGPFQDLGSGASVPATAKEAFLGRFADARAVAQFSACETGFSFKGAASSDGGGFAELGTERNGVFL